ncbi:DUF4124 domain-containing protein [Solimonas soli]|uniref:DUF4124 domain-containing protein n=1 Tax=Solimonas soli TaxID=413479 RepID=UPI00048005B7|nr:DUF4124 domain-containing protein [Solimonas soli]
MQDHNRAGRRSCRGWYPYVLALALGAPAAQAAVYRCSVGGVVQFSDRPCQAGDAPLDLKAPNVVKADDGAAPLAEQYDRRVREYGKARAAEDAAWRKDHEARSADAERLRAARARREVVRGMSAADVRRLLGEPRTTATASGKGGTKETWTYADEGDGRVTVTLQGGVVSDVRRGGGRKRK